MAIPISKEAIDGFIDHVRLAVDNIYPINPITLCKKFGITCYYSFDEDCPKSDENGIYMRNTYSIKSNRYFIIKEFVKIMIYTRRGLTDKDIDIEDMVLIKCLSRDILVPPKILLRYIDKGLSLDELCDKFIVDRCVIWSQIDRYKLLGERNSDVLSFL